MWESVSDRVNAEYGIATGNADQMDTWLGHVAGHSCAQGEEDLRANVSEEEGSSLT